ncbi:hypothetical protein C2E21_7108 [Chlorella sorokiniana]|uniref:Uncharacterized protein n=1 Tax=Chlorella sorokiniana TaxID=3076 RepID=A0A2P6TJ13_CHLSO|nr:hypothetical protein C2E21_7108 [Chlorella sorokiniana]|eukprot:PRW39236.1 hypothetical protein C2E21_7108 [Chlorella sorokiniana]
MAAPTCPLHTADHVSQTESGGHAVPELRAYKLGKSRWSYNLVELVLREGGSGSLQRSTAVVHAAANGVRFAAAAQDSAVGFLLQLENGAKVQAHVFLCYADAQPCSHAAAAAARGGGGCSGGDEDDAQFAWSLVTRQHCCKGCQGAVLRSIQRFGRVGPRQAKGPAPEQPAEAAGGAQPAASSGRKQPARKDPRFMYLSLDEACTHVNARAFRLVAGIYNRQGSRLLGTAVSPPIRVLANNDAPTGAARIVLEATLPSDWEGWSGGSGSKRSAAAKLPHRKPKLAPSLPFYSCSQVAAQCEAERQLTLLQQLKASMAVAGSTTASSCGSPVITAGGWNRNGSFAQEMEQPPRWLPGTPLAVASPACPPATSPFLSLPPSDSVATTDTTLPAACSFAMARTAPVGGYSSPGYSSPGGAGCLPLPLPPKAGLEPGLGLGGECGRECGVNESLDLEKLHSLMGDFDSCGLDLELGSIFDDSDALAFAL